MTPPRLQCDCQKARLWRQSPIFLCSPASEDEALAKTLQRPAVAAETFAGKPLPGAFDLWQGFAYLGSSGLSLIRI